jgi:hypothetical protein
VVGIEPTSSNPLPRFIDRLDSNKKLKKSKCFIQCRLGTRKPFFLSLSCTEFVPNSQSTQCCVVSHLLLQSTDDRITKKWVPRTSDAVIWMGKRARGISTGAA